MNWLYRRLTLSFVTKVVAALFSLKLGWLLIQVFRLPYEDRLPYYSDDGFYYLQLVKNFVESGVWTFDGGLSKTSGFHLLYAYFLVGIYHLSAFLEIDFVTVSVIASAALPVAGVALSVYCARFSCWSLLLGLILLASSAAISNVPFLVEWPMAIAFWLVSLVFLKRVFSLDADLLNAKLSPVFGFFIGLIAITVRSDSGVVLAAALVIIAILWIRYRPPGLIKVGAGLLFGTALGVAILSIHTRYFTGSFMQSSGAVKRFWGQSLQEMHPTWFGSRWFDNLAYLNEPLVPLFFIDRRTIGIFLVILICIALLCFVVQLLKKKGEVKDVAFSAWGGFSLLAVSGVYAGFSGQQSWYSASLFLPLTALLSISVIFSPQRRPLILASCLVIALINFFMPIEGRSPIQKDMLLAAKLLDQKFPGETAAAFNAGIVGYHRQAGRVVNLDGLVNDAIFPYIKSNTTFCFLKDHEIRLLADDTDTLFDAAKTIRGGYAGEANLAFLKELLGRRTVVSPGKNHLAENTVNIFEVDVESEALMKVCGDQP
jgi:hypothetical protein